MTIRPLAVLALAIPFVSTLLFLENTPPPQDTLVVRSFQSRGVEHGTGVDLLSGRARQANNKTGTFDHARSIHDVFGKQIPTKCADNLPADGKTQPRVLPEILSVRPL